MINDIVLFFSERLSFRDIYYSIYKWNKWYNAWDYFQNYRDKEIGVDLDEIRLATQW